MGLVPDGPNMTLRVILMRARRGVALPSLNSVQASSQRWQATHRLGSAMMRPLAVSRITYGRTPVLARASFKSPSAAAADAAFRKPRRVRSCGSDSFSRMSLRFFRGGGRRSPRGPLRPQCVPDACGGMTLSFERGCVREETQRKMRAERRLIRCSIPIGRIYEAALIKFFEPFPLSASRSLS